MCFTYVVVVLMCLGQVDALRQRPRFRAPESAPASRPAEERYEGLLAARIPGIRDRFKTNQVAGVNDTLQLWRDIGYRSYEPLQVAAELADEPAAQSTLLDGFRELFENANRDDRVSMRAFFGNPARILVKRMADPEPLLKLAVDCGNWSSITRWEGGSQALKDKYVLRGLRTSSAHPGNDWMASLTGSISPSAYGELREVARRLSAEAPNSRGFDIAVRTLVEADDTAIIADLEKVLADDKLASWNKGRVEVYLAKLKHQHSVEGLLHILRTEKSSQDVLTWAALRLLWLKTDRQTVYSALATPRPVGPHGEDVAERVEQYLHNAEVKDAGGAGVPYVNLLVPDAVERGRRNAEVKRDQDPAERGAFMRQMRTHVIVTSAPAGD